MKQLCLMILAACTLILAGCPSTPITPAKVTEAQPSTPSQGTGAQTGTIPAVQTPGDAGPEGPMDGILGKRSVYFDLDSYVVKEDFRPVVEAHAAYLKAHPDRRVTLEGNADERGSSEYNLALGQKRSEAVKSMMRVLGVSESQLEAVSFGKERPKNPGHDETAWTENRRVDITYKHP